MVEHLQAQSDAAFKRLHAAMKAAGPAKTDGPEIGVLYQAFLAAMDRVNDLSARLAQAPKPGGTQAAPQ
jgi:hypothetical protein